ncbi:MAG: protein translocase subunit SecDF [Bacteroidales bacterium]|nr:protein translocase subunit SecDF [Bacteroidales bacterium]
MQNKGAIRLLAILFALVSLYQLSFSYFTSREQKKAVEYSNGPAVLNEAKAIAERTNRPENYFIDSLKKTSETYYLDSIANEEIYSFGFFGYTYKECKEREINLGLDLKGGMNVTLEVSVQDVVIAMAGSNKIDPHFTKAISDALKAQQNSQDDFITLFYQAWQQDNPGLNLASIFATVELKDLVAPNSTDEEVLKVLQDQATAAIGNTFDILSKRIDQFGVAQPRIQKMQNGRILVELPGVKDPRRVRKILQSTARLEFWETYNFNNPKIFNALTEANAVTEKYYAVSKGDAAVEEKVENQVDTNTDAEEAAISTEENTDSTELALGDESELNLDAEATDDELAVSDENAVSLFKYLRPNFSQGADGKWYPGNGAVMGTAMVRDTARVNTMLKLAQVKGLFPRDMKLLWGVKPPKYMKTSTGMQINALELFILQVKSRDGEPPLDGEVITDARHDYSQTGVVEVNMQMNSEGAHIWKNLTHDNLKKSIAIVLDNYVYSAPTVQSEIAGGRSQITGNFTVEEASDLANVLKSGKLPVPAHIIEEAIVGPSLGKEAVTHGLWSFIGAFVLVLVYMVFFYNKAGLIADLALIANMFFLFGVLASLQAVLTLPGIAGIVLTLGMAVDANVIIFERIKEEIRAGKGIRLAISDGYKNAYSAIIDGNVTTLITGIVLFVFGSGPVQGFATTLIIGIITSLFSAIFISRLVFGWLLDRNKTISFSNKMTANFLANANFDFIGFRKKAYIISGTVIIIGIASLAFKGLNYGVDFSGGRTYVVRFDNAVNSVDVANDLKTKFIDANGKEIRPEVKTFGPVSQVKITTKYLIDSKDITTDSIVDRAVFEGLKNHFVKEISYEEFASSDDFKSMGLMSSQKVDPTISDDLVYEAYGALFFALIAIFLYIALRFRKWQYGLGGLAALVHDSLIVVSVYSIFSGILPFDMEVDQAFIAAILTIIGYSINDSVIIFDRIREMVGMHPKRSIKENMNVALNSTLSRTVNTSGTTIVVLLTIFIFGGEVIRGFAFALLLGVIVGTYSSVFVASPVTYETLKKDDDARLEAKKAKKKKK